MPLRAARALAARVAETVNPSSSPERRRARRASGRRAGTEMPSRRALLGAPRGARVPSLGVYPFPRDRASSFRRSGPRGHRRLTKAQHAEFRRHFRAAFAGRAAEEIFARFSPHDHGRVGAADFLRGVRLHLRLPVSTLPDEDALRLFLELDERNREALEVAELVAYLRRADISYPTGRGDAAAAKHIPW